MGTKVFDNALDLITFTRASGGTALRKISYGPELVTNGTFDTDVSGWTLTNVSGTATFTQSSGQATFVRQAFGDKVSQAITCTVGKVYEVSCDLTAVSGGTARVRFNSTNTPTGAGSVADAASSGAFSSVIVADATTMYFVFDTNANGSSVTIDNISVKEVLFDRPDGTLTLFNHPNNVPRIEYDAAGAVKGLLVEEARVNLLLRSEEFDNAVWQTNVGTCTVVPNAVVAPDGNLTADELTFVGTNANRYASVSGLTIGASYTFSVWLRVASGSATMLFGNIDGIFQSVTVTDSWQRFSVTQNATGTTRFPMIRGTDLTAYAWGAQLEAGAFATSYMPTTIAPATRAADIASIPVSAFGYNQQAGSVVVEFDRLDPTSAKDIIMGATNSSFNPSSFGIQGGSALVGYVRANSAYVGQANVGSGITAEAKAGLSFGGGAILGCANGGTVTTSTITGYPTTVTEIEFMNIGVTSGPHSGYIKSLTYYPRKVTAAQLQELTS